MGKNITGGKKHKKAKNYVSVVKLIEADNEFQFYATVNKKLGGGNFSVDVFIPEKIEIKNIDGEHQTKIIRSEEVRRDQIALIRGSIKKRCRIDVGNIILVSVREFEKRKVDIIHAYKNDEVSTMRRNDMLPKSKIFDNDVNSDINFENFDSEDENEIKNTTKSSYISNHDLIPNNQYNSKNDNDNEDDYEDEIDDI